MPKLYRRGAIYYIIVHVPADLVDAMDAKQKWVSLRTADPKEARRREAAERDQWAATFDAVRRQRQLTPDDVALAVWDHHSAGLAAADIERGHRPTDAEIVAATDKALADARKSGAADLGGIAMLNAMTDVEVLAGKAQWTAQRRAVRLGRLKADLGSGDTRLIEPAADAFLAKHNFRIDRSGDQYRDLCQKLMRAEIDQLRLTAERDSGDFTGKPADPIIAEPVDRLDEFDASADTIMGLFAKYERDKKKVRPEYLKQARRDVQHFADFVGPRVRPSRIEKKQVRDWQEALEKWPVKATEITAFQGMTIREIIKANAALPLPKPTIATQTIRRYMSGLGGFCRWLTKKGYLSVNPVEDMLPDKEVTFPRRGLTDAEIRTLFASPLFTGCDGTDWNSVDQAGDVAIRDHRYWIPYIMAYAGARPGEVAQLFVNDVREEVGIWLMHITELGGEGKRTKTEGSARVVPIHSELIRLGFLDHVEAIRAEGEQRVFPEIELPEVGQIAPEFSRQFNRYLADIGIKTGKDVVAYSLRHTFVDKGRAAGYMDAEIALIVGHETGLLKKTVTAGYGTRQQGTLEWRKMLVEAVTY